MKKLLLSTMVLGSTIALSACGGVPTCSGESLDDCDRSGPYTEERTIGTRGGNVNLGNVGTSTAGTTTITAPAGTVVSGEVVSGGTVSGDTIVRSAEPVFENSQVK